jgi:hypothetical protein
MVDREEKIHADLETSGVMDVLACMASKEANSLVTCY